MQVATTVSLNHVAILQESVKASAGSMVPSKASRAAVQLPPGLPLPSHLVSGAVAHVSTDLQQGAAADRPETVQVLLFLLLPSFQASVGCSGLF